MASGIVIVGRTPEEIVRDDARAIRHKLPLESRRKAIIAERIMASAAPRDTGRLARSVQSRQTRHQGSGRFEVGFEITAGALRDGFPYLDVSRFGHRGAFVFPKQHRRLAVHAEGRTRRPIFRTFVRAYHPRRDWVEVGVNRATRALTRLG